MTLIIEDGSLVSGANSYVSDAEYVAYAAARGKSIGLDATAREIELIKAMDYIEGHRAKFKGDKFTEEQALQWPRAFVQIDGFYIDTDEIPVDLKNAQLAAASILNTEDLLLTGSNQNIQREKLDKLEVAYFSGGSYETVRTETVDVYLNSLLKAAGGAGINAQAFRA